jgi:hypothetical protein
LFEQIISFDNSGHVSYYINPDYKSWFPEPMFKFNISTTDNTMIDFPTTNYFAGTTGILMHSHLKQDTVYNNYFGFTGSVHNSDIYFISGNILHISKIDNSFYNGLFIIIDDIDPEKKIDNAPTIFTQFQLNSKLGSYSFEKKTKVELDHDEIANNLDSEFINKLCQNG